MLDSFHENTIEAWGVSVYGRQMSTKPILLHKIACPFHMVCNRLVALTNQLSLSNNVPSI